MVSSSNLALSANATHIHVYQAFHIDSMVSTTEKLSSNADKLEEHNGSVVECLTRDIGVAGLKPH